MERRVYLDHAATTPLDPEVLQAMLPYLQSDFGNPSALYAEGRAARRAVDQARDAVADALGADSPGEIIFTGSGTEADNLALRGPLEAARQLGLGDHLVVSQIEHHAVLHTAQALERTGFRVTYVPPEPSGIVDPERILECVTEQTVLVSVMLANNEIGTIQPVRTIAQVCRPRGVLIHTDAVQAVGHIPVNVQELQVDLLSLSAHKFYGPKGIGALYVRKGTPMEPHMTGGGQELERRAGTENVAGIVGMAEALRRAMVERDVRASHIRVLSDTFVDGVLRRITGVTFNGDRSQCLPGIVNLTFEDVDGESLLLNLDLHGVAASTGSACSAGSVEPSYVLTAMGRRRELARQALRFSLGHRTTEADITYVVDTLERLVGRLRSRSGKNIN